MCDNYYYCLGPLPTLSYIRQYLLMVWFVYNIIHIKVNYERPSEIVSTYDYVHKIGEEN